MECLFPYLMQSTPDNEIRKTINILLLGVSEAGKSTILKQMRILNGKPFTEDEKKELMQYIRRNCHQSIYALVEQVKVFGMKYGSETSVKSAEFILGLGSDTPELFTNCDYLEHVQSLWLDSTIQKCYRRSHEFHLMDCAK